MSRHATLITLTEDDRQTLERWLRSSTIEQPLALRAQIVLAAARGQPTQRIAEELKQRPATVSK